MFRLISFVIKTFFLFKLKSLVFNLFCQIICLTTQLLKFSPFLSFCGHLLNFFMFLSSSQSPLFHPPNPVFTTAFFFEHSAVHYLILFTCWRYNPSLIVLFLEHCSPSHQAWHPVGRCVRLSQLYHSLSLWICFPIEWMYWIFQQVVHVFEGSSITGVTNIEGREVCLSCSLITDTYQFLLLFGIILHCWFFSVYTIFSVHNFSK